MKRLMSIIIIVNLLIVGCWVYFSDDYKVAARDAISGVMIKQDSPENTVASLYQVVFDSPEGAATLFYDPAYTYTANDIQTIFGDGSIVQIEPAKIYSSSQNRDFAVVGLVQKATFDGEVQYYLEAYTLKRIDNRWYFVGDSAIEDLETYVVVYQLAYEMAAKVYGDTVDGLTEAEMASIQEQAGNFALSIQQGLESLVYELNQEDS